MQAPILDVAGLSKTYENTPVFENLDFSLYPGELMLVVGINGSGKSTLMRILAGLVRPTHGVIRLESREYLKDDFHLRAQIGYCPADENTFFPNAVVLENLRFFGRLYGTKGSSCDQRIFQLAQELEFTDCLKKPFQDLSSGQKKRLSLARALVHHPRLLLLDELLGPLDQQYRVKTLEFIKNYVSVNQAACLLSTHSLQDDYLGDLASLSLS